MKKFERNQVAKAISLALTGSAIAAFVVAPAQAQNSSPALEEIIVTAQKREQSLQDVAVSIQVLDNQQLENLNIRSFEDFIDFLPTVSYDFRRPRLREDLHARHCQRRRRQPLCVDAQRRLLPGRAAGHHD